MGKKTKHHQKKSSVIVCVMALQDVHILILKPCKNVNFRSKGDFVDWLN